MQLNEWQWRQHGSSEDLPMQWRTLAAGWSHTGEGSSGETARVMRVADGTSTSSGTCVVQCGMVWYGAMWHGAGSEVVLRGRWDKCLPASAFSPSSPASVCIEKL